ncbi:MAG TPA: response regulator [Candidatus Dormibacteraeota bacterium]|nr:response regulator [Candidatus Dormibacteraeota bacterium]
MRLTAVGAQRMTDNDVLGSAASGSPIDVLLIEDNLYDVDMTTHALKDSILPDRIKAIHDGAEALDFIFCTGDYADRNPRQQPKLILLDLQLPKVEGLEVLRRIRADPLTEEIPVVIFTHSTEDRNVIEGYKLGDNSFLVKRHDFDEFMKAIQALGIYWLVMNRPPVHRAATFLP